jgi:hypothetical protein
MHRSAINLYLAHVRHFNGWQNHFISDICSCHISLLASIYHSMFSTVVCNPTWSLALHLEVLLISHTLNHENRHHIKVFFSDTTNIELICMA